ncbi:MAG: bifunctional UDP-N-acetylmuramoyl-tripeptide:D-alanyl-D-alanine ligase/alanine racemase, partial [Bacteroidetes bacterium]|nr:bifunctional UDP-N-acetylmuramoyl-tripeptide:D-alanyl-D-alanine ligase/alanine racemase [Bacteroidota bacterium]
MNDSMAHIAELLHAKCLQIVQPSARIEFLALDSRQLSAPTLSLFFALPGQRHNGHHYIQEAYQSGVRNFVVSEAITLEHLPLANVLQVPNTLQALQALAAAHRALFNYPVVGITGSNGKTIVKEWLSQLLASDFQIVRSPKSYNSQVGVPLSVWQMQPRHNLGIFEAGISQTGEMEKLAAIIQPQLGIFTNIGPAHQEGFDSEQAKIEEKMRLFASASHLVYCSDYPGIAAAAEKWKVQTGGALLAWSAKGNTAILHLTHQEVRPDGSTSLQISYSESTFDLVLPFNDAASIENAMHCVLVMLHFHIDPVHIAARLARLEPVEMRLEMKAAINRCTLINDAYSNDLSSLHIALQFARLQAHNERITLILSDILQSGSADEALYETVAQEIKHHSVQRLIGIGKAIPQIQKFLPSNLEQFFYQDTDAFLHDFARLVFEDTLILLKGARVFAFERIAFRLEQKAHKTVLEVNLSALVHNLNVYNRLLQPGAKMMVMVKAAGYGSGAAELAKLLEFHKVEYLGVAYADEGIELRQAGVKLPILVLNPEPRSFDAMYRHRLEPEIYSLGLWQELTRYAGKDKKMDIHLKLDTGMHRLGFESEALTDFLLQIKEYPNLKVKSVFSHLSASDMAQHDDFTHQQARVFGTYFTQICQTLGYAPMRHLLNSGGISRFPQYHFEMVRLGIGLYGIDSAGLQGQLQVVNR